MLNYILFDFDGTLINSRDLFMAVYNQLALKNDFLPITESNLQELKQLPMLNRFKMLRVPLYKLPFLANSFISQYKAGINTISFMPEMDKLLHKIAGEPVKRAILSSNSAATIKNFLALQQITTINDVYCSSNIFGKHKLIQSFLKKKKTKT